MCAAASSCTDSKLEALSTEWKSIMADIERSGDIKDKTTWWTLREHINKTMAEFACKLERSLFGFHRSVLHGSLANKEQRRLFNDNLVKLRERLQKSELTAGLISLYKLQTIEVI